MLQKVKEFVQTSNKVLIMSYETVFKYIDIIRDHIDLIICDEGHRLKNTKIKLFQVLDSFPSKKRILVTGTPIQNNLKELFACVRFVNPILFPSEEKFKKIYISKNYFFNLEL